MTGVDEIQITREELQSEAEALATDVLHASAAEAWRRIASGELEGTLFASKMMRIRWLLGEDSIAPLPVAAE